MKDLFKPIARFVLGNYQLFHIYTRSNNDASQVYESPADNLDFAQLDQTQIVSSNDQAIRERAWYFGKDSDCFGCLVNGRIVAMCVFWHGDRYHAERNFLPLGNTEAKLVEIITLPEMRGRRIAPRLVAFAERAMFKKGYTRLYARIWHSNNPSLRAFETAGWNYLNTVIEIRPFGIGQNVRLKLKLNRSGDQSSPRA